MIPELLASAIMLRRMVVDDGFVRAVANPAPDGIPVYARMIRGAAVSIVTGLIPTAVALLVFPMALGLPLASAALLVVTCDWLLSFCGARVKIGLSDAGVSFDRIPACKRRMWRGAAVPFASFLVALAFACLAFHPPSF